MPVCCGNMVSPPLFESIELIGRADTLARIDATVEIGFECFDILIESASCVFNHPASVLVGLVEDSLFCVSDFVLQLSAPNVCT